MDSYKNTAITRPPTGTNPNVGHVFNYHRTDGRQVIRRSDGSELEPLYVGDVDFPDITTDYIPKGTGTNITDGNWAFSVNDIYPVTDGANIGLTGTNRVGTIFMASTIDYANNLIFSETGSEKMRLTTGGFLGIGTATNTTYPLEIKANVGFGEFLTFNRDHITNETVAIRFQRQGNNTWALGASIQNGSGHEFALYDYVLGGSPIYVKDAHTGFNGGLGGFDPGLWQVGIRATSHRTLLLTTNSFVNETNVIAFANSNTSTDIKWVIGSDIDGAAVRSFGIADNVTGTRPFYIDGSGNFGFGHAVLPTAKVHIKGAGSTSATYALYLENSNTQSLFQLT